MTTESRSARGYDRLACCYGLLEWFLFGNELQRGRVSQLESIGSPRKVLLLGDGNGRLLEQLCMRHPQCQIKSVDQSARMLERQRRRVERVDAMDRVTFEQANLEQFQFADESFDVLMAAFFLDCFSNEMLERLLPRWLSTIRGGGYFVFVDFVDPDPSRIAMVSRAKLSMMHTFFRWTTGLQNRCLPNWNVLFDCPRYQLIHGKEFGNGLISSRLYQVQ